MNEKLTAEDVSAATKANIEASLQPEGKYIVQNLTDTVRIKVRNDGGSRYLSMLFGTLETENGEKAYSKGIYKIVPFMGEDKNGKPNHIQFSRVFTALGFNPEEVAGLHSSVLAQADGAAVGAPIDVSLTINGEPVSLKGRKAMATIGQETWSNGTTVNTLNGIYKL